MSFTVFLHHFYLSNTARHKLALEAVTRANLERIEDTKRELKRELSKAEGSAAIVALTNEIASLNKKHAEHEASMAPLVKEHKRMLQIAAEDKAIKANPKLKAFHDALVSKLSSYHASVVRAPYHPGLCNGETFHRRFELDRRNAGMAHVAVLKFTKSRQLPRHIF